MSKRMINGALIRQKLEEMGKSQSWLARQVGCSQPTITAVVAGEQQSSKKLPRIAAVLGVSVADLDPEYGSILPPAILERPQVAHRVTRACAMVIRILRQDIGDGDAQDIAEAILSLAALELDSPSPLTEEEQRRLLLRGAVQAILKAPQ